MKICHKLTDEENIELYKITKLLKSEDPESIELGIGLLENYPENAQARYCISEKSWRYTDKLRHIIFSYRSGIFGKFDFFYNTYTKDISPIIDFVVKILLDQQYYYEENENM